MIIGSDVELPVSGEVRVEEISNCRCEPVHCAYRVLRTATRDEWSVDVERNGGNGEGWLYRYFYEIEVLD